MTAFERMCRGYASVLRVLGYISGGATFVMMFLIVANATSRKLFNHPLEGTHEMTESSMVLVVFLALAYTQMKGGHIRIALLTRYLPIRRQHLFFFFALTVAGLFFALASYGTLQWAIEAFSVGERTWGNVPYPVWPLKGLISIGLALLSIQFFLDAIRDLLIASGRVQDGVVGLTAEGEL